MWVFPPEPPGFSHGEAQNRHQPLNGFQDHHPGVALSRVHSTEYPRAAALLMIMAS